MSLLAELMAKREGYGIPGAVPTRDNNPLDLRHSPHSEHAGDPDAIGQIDTLADGWADAERQLQLWAERGLTLAEAITTEAPPTENDTASYLAFVCQGLGISVEEAQTMSVADALKIPGSNPNE